MTTPTQAEAEAAARRLIAVDEGGGSEDIEYLDVICVARAYLALSSQAAGREAKHPMADRPELRALLDKATAHFNSLTPEQQKAHLREQAKSWARQDKD